MLLTILGAIVLILLLVLIATERRRYVRVIKSSPYGRRDIRNPAHPEHQRYLSLTYKED